MTKSRANWSHKSRLAGAETHIKPILGRILKWECVSAQFNLRRIMNL